MLLVYPHFARNLFLNFEYMAPFYPGKTAVMPPLGLLTFAGLAAQAGWELRLVDENVAHVGDDDLRWADVVAVSGMHPQRNRIVAIIDRANALGKLTVLGGPSVSICPEFYPNADILHVGELGDATAAMLEWLDHAREKPGVQRVFETRRKLDLDEQPLPALQLIDIHAYLVLPVQFSVGCPYTCEFCDIPRIFGRVPRLKSSRRVIAEFQAAYDAGFIGTMLFVDDNLIGNKKALRRMLPDLIEWQKAHGYPFAVTAEASVNLADDPDILQLLHDVRLTHMFLGVESPDHDTLTAISKRQNTRAPLLDSIRTIQEHGIEIIMGMIFGFDTDTEHTGRNTTRFVQLSQAPIVYFNLLAALPKTALWERLASARRLVVVNGDVLASQDLLSCLSTNVRFRLDGELVQQMLIDTVRQVYSPEDVYARFDWNAHHVYGKQIQGVPPAETWAQRLELARHALVTLSRVVYRIGIRAHYRRHFWRFVATLVRLRVRGRLGGVLEILLRVAPNAHHLITWGATLVADHMRAQLDSQATTADAVSAGE